MEFKQESKETQGTKMETLDDDIQEDVNITFELGKSRTRVSISKKILVGLSVLFNTALETDPTTTTLCYDEYEPETFSEMKKYMEYHHQKPVQIPEQPARHKNFSLCVSDKWDAEFINGLWADPARRKTFFDLLNMANWMDVKCLLHKLCCKVGCEVMTIPEKPAESLQDRLKAVLDPANVASGTRATRSALQKK